LARKAMAALLGLAVAAVAAYTAQAGVSSGGDHCATYRPHIPSPSQFSKVIDNPYFPLPAGRTLVYRGVENGKKELDRMHVTSRTKKIDGITATVVSDNVYEPTGKLAEKTFDYYAQDDRGGVWYLGENTREFLRGGKVDTSGSWLAGKNGAKPGLIMEAHPRCQTATARSASPVRRRTWPGWWVEAARRICCGRWSSHPSSPRSSSGRSTARGSGSSPSSNSPAVTRRSSSCG
jgi:hypothetical protein